MERRLYFAFVFFFLFGMWVCADGSRYAANSVLSEGLWKKIKIEETGIYKITYDELKKMGFADPAAVSVHGYGGWPLDEDFTRPYVDDLPAVAVFRGDDYLLFYGRGPVKWEYDAVNKRFKHTNNPYSVYGCYFLTNSTPVKEMEMVSLLKDDAALKITDFDDYRLYEEDNLSLNKSGRDLFWKKFSNRTLSVSLESMPGTIQNTQSATCRIISKTTKSQQLTLSVNEKEVSRQEVPQITGRDELKNIEYVKGKSLEFAAGWEGLENKIKLTFTLSSATDASLDYVRLQAKRVLKTYGEACLFFRSMASLNNTSRFVVEGADANTLVFDVTDAFNPKRMDTNLAEAGLSFTIPGSYGLREFALVQKDKTFSAIKANDAEDVKNQNLHALPAKDLIIISPLSLCDEALRLAEVHEKRDDLRVLVVTPEEIYNEFSSGTPDATAYRRFVKMFYDRRKPDGSDVPRHLLLFGDGAFDNRFLTDEWKRVSESERSNMLLTYQTEESLNMYSYAVDDYFGFLDDKETVFQYQGIHTYSSATLDIGVGRFPVRTLAQAKNMVDKIITYMDNRNAGFWKNSVTFLADDGSNGDGFDTVHQNDADFVAQKIEVSRPAYMINKVYYDAYKKSVGATYPYPDVRKEIQNILNKGTLILNYTGHGGTDALSDEKVITNNDIVQAKYTSLPLWITATCDFCRFDDIKTSAGENVFLSAKSGGIALFTTSRVAFTGINKEINLNLIAHLLQDDDYKSTTFGDVLRKTKTGVTDGPKLGFNLIGDPALKLSYPTHQIQVMAINGKAVDDIVTFKAFEKVYIEGVVSEPDGQLASGFNGEMNVKILDGKQTYTTLGNNSPTKKVTYQDYSGTMFKGTCLVMDGKFRFSFIVPKNISYSDMNCGKMSFYALDETTSTEAQGYFQKFVANGTADDYEKDTDAPEIRAIYLNDSTFTDGGQVNTAPYFFARLWDKSGVNITGNSPGHEINLTIDNNPRQNYTLDNYYEDVPGREGEGVVKFPVPQLEPGLHTAVFKVWDIMDNTRNDTITFEVVEGLKPFLSELTANPSPARENVEFRFSHNRPACRMKVAIMVYDLAGRLMWRHEETGTSDIFQDYVVNWDLSKADGSRMRTGIYLYRAAISTDNSKEATEAKKMIVLSGR